MLDPASPKRFSIKQSFYIPPKFYLSGRLICAIIRLSFYKEISKGVFYENSQANGNKGPDKMD
jgi:hypothetical protein